MGGDGDGPYAFGMEAISNMAVTAVVDENECSDIESKRLESRQKLLRRAFRLTRTAGFVMQTKCYFHWLTETGSTIGVLAFGALICRFP